MSSQTDPQVEDNQPRQPIFNVPGTILALIIAFGAVHLYRVYGLNPREALEFVFTFGYVPAREAIFPQSTIIASLSTAISYSFLHGDSLHLGLNCLWLLAFGSPVAKRIGVLRFLLLAVASSLAGALAHQLTHMGEVVPMIGASAIVSGFMGAALRFAFPASGGIASEPALQPRQGIIQTFTNRSAMVFLVVWLALNVVFGAGLIDITGAGQSIAWQAHIGGFLVGFLGFKVFD